MDIINCYKYEMTNFCQQQKYIITISYMTRKGIGVKYYVHCLLPGSNKYDKDIQMHARGSSVLCEHSQRDFSGWEKIALDP